MTVQDHSEHADAWYHRMVAVVVFLVACAALATIAARDGIPLWERAAFTAVNQLGEAWWPWFATVMQTGTVLAGPAAGLIAISRRRPVLAWELALGGPVAWLVARLLKEVVGRQRPYRLLPDVVIRGGEVGGLGFPSGHVSVATAIAAIASAWIPPRWRWLPWLVVAAVGAARMYAGAHLPLDVAGGVLVGLVVGAAARHAAQVIISRRARGA